MEEIDTEEVVKKLKKKCNFLDIDSSEGPPWKKRVCTMKGGCLEEDQYWCDGVENCIFHKQR